MEDKDHDLLIRIDTNLANLRDDFKEFKRGQDNLESRVKTLETAKLEWEWLKGVGKFVWTGVLGLTSLVISLVVHYFVPAPKH
jgi:hypothetical protein